LIPKAKASAGERISISRLQPGESQLTYAPVGALLETLIAVLGRRWAIEESLGAAKGEVGLDQYEVRHSHGWYRHITLAMLALAYLTVVRSQLPGSALKGGRWWRGWPPTTA
jgi:SRSO17 transposase